MSVKIVIVKSMRGLRHKMTVLLAAGALVGIVRADMDVQSGGRCVRAPSKFDVSAKTSTTELAQSLLRSWCDGLIALQVGEFQRPEFRGGVLCPACGFLHGRIGDAVYPLVYLYVTTGETKYLKAAESVVDWCEANMLLPTGLYRNDRQTYWRSTTAFFTIPLWKTLDSYGDRLPAETRKKWRRIFVRASSALYDLYENGFNTVINYYCIYPEAMYLAWKETGETRYLDAAKRRAKWIADNAFNADGLLYGEGFGATGTFDTTKRGCNLVDFGYNLEESLAALIAYAKMTGDAELLRKASDSAKTQMAFVLPDGAIDDSCGSRSVKWTYYGSRTSDGILPLLVELADELPYASRLSRRVLLLYARCTGSDGLIRGGFMYDEAGEPACVHHSFARAKTLVDFLRSDLGHRPDSGAALPREVQKGDLYFRTLDTHLVACGSWRSTFTANDAYNISRSAAVSGGTLSLLWHEGLGPVLVATLGDYFYAEPMNMQDDRHDMRMNCLAPRITAGRHSNIFDYESTAHGGMKGDGFVYSASGRLTDAKGNKTSEYSLGYTLTSDGLDIRVSSADPLARYLIPLVAGKDDEVRIDGKVATIRRGGWTIRLEVSTDVVLDKCDRGDRIWSPVAGMLCVPLSLSLKEPISMRLECRAN